MSAVTVAEARYRDMAGYEDTPPYRAGMAYAAECVEAAPGTQEWFECFYVGVTLHYAQLCEALNRFIGQHGSKAWMPLVFGTGLSIRTLRNLASGEVPMTPGVACMIAETIGWEG